LALLGLIRPCTGAEIERVFALTPFIAAKGSDIGRSEVFVGKETVANWFQAKRHHNLALRPHKLNPWHEGISREVIHFCLQESSRWNFARTTILASSIPFDLKEPMFRTQLDIGELAPRLLAFARTDTDTLFLQFNDVVAERQPGVVWEVYVGAPATERLDSKSPYYVGNLALFGAGIRSDTHGAFTPAHVEFAINNAVVAWGKGRPRKLPLVFISHGALINGQSTDPRPQSSVHVGQLALIVETRTPNRGELGLGELLARTTWN
jgi:hypothetical protein